MSQAAEQTSDGTNKKKRSRLLQMGHRLIHSKRMLPGIGIASFLEALIIPIPLETILIPLMQARREQIFLISTVVLAGCILAALVGYGIGYFVFDAIGHHLVSLVSSEQEFEKISQQMESKGFWFVFSVGVAPIPFQIAMLAAGATKFSLWSFLIATALSRAIRYYGLGLLVYWTGNRAQEIFERHRKTTGIVLFVVVAVIWYFAIF